MSVPPEQFVRIRDKVNLADLDTRLVVIVGVGSVGSQIAKELAHSGVGRLHFIDGKPMREVNVIRHALPRKYVGQNKAEALTLSLAGEVPTLQPKGLARDIDDDMSDAELDSLLEDADLIVAATDDRRAQRRIGARARVLDVAAVFPGLYEDDGGEVFIQREAELPCFSCWDDFREETLALRGATALNVDTLPVLFLAVELCLGLLDSDSVYFRRLVARERGQPLPLLFRLSVRDELALGTPRVSKRENCPVCGQSRPEAMRRPVSGFPLPAPIRNSDLQPLIVAISICTVFIAVVLIIMTTAGSNKRSSVMPVTTVPHRRLIDTLGIGAVKIGMNPDRVRQVLGRPYRATNRRGYWIGLYRAAGGIFIVYYGQPAIFSHALAPLVARSLITNIHRFRTAQNVGVGDDISAVAQAYKKENRHESAYAADFVEPEYYRQNPEWIFPPEVTAQSQVYEYWLSATGGERLIFSTIPYSRQVAWVGVGTCCIGPPDG